MTKTDWFSSKITPVHAGRYEVRNRPEFHWRRKYFLTGDNWRFWDGKTWLCWENGPVSVFGMSLMHEWRGLAEKPVPNEV